MTTNPLRFAMAYMIDARASLLLSVEHMKEGSGESSNGLRFNPKKSLYMSCSTWASLPIECWFQRAAPGSVRAISKEIAGQEQFAQASPSLRLEALNLRKSGDSRPHICARQRMAAAVIARRHCVQSLHKKRVNFYRGRLPQDLN